MAEKKKMESTFLNMVVVLTLIAVISAFALGYVYTITKEPIEKGKIAKKNLAVKTVLPPFKTKEEKKFGDSTIYVAKDDAGNYVGAAIETKALGFNDDVKLMVGFDKDDKIVKISVVDQKETPGLGTKMDESKFKDQFNGKDLSKFKSTVTKDGGDVEAITAATISSRAFSKAVKLAYHNLQLNKPKFLKSSAKEEAKETVEKEKDNKEIEIKTEEISEKKTFAEKGGKK
jgi:electron transport complex protein RnfG